MPSTRSQHLGLTANAGAVRAVFEVMPMYRCYLLNWSDHIVSVDSLQADGDDIAMVMAAGLLREQHLTSAAMEVWNQKGASPRRQ